MGRLVFIARLWGVLGELRAIFDALHGARVYLEAFAVQLEQGDKTQTPVTVTVSGAQLRGLLKVVRAVLSILDKIPHTS